MRPSTNSASGWPIDNINESRLVVTDSFSSFSEFVSFEDLMRILNILRNTKIDIKPADTETAFIIGRTVSWAAMGAGLAMGATVVFAAPVSLPAAAIIGALVGGGAGYFTATHTIRITQINPGSSEPVFQVVISPE